MMVGKHKLGNSSGGERIKTLVKCRGWVSINGGTDLQQLIQARIHTSVTYLKHSKAAMSVSGIIKERCTVFRTTSIKGHNSAVTCGVVMPHPSTSGGNAPNNFKCITVVVL